jgi:hypothetical protein
MCNALGEAAAMLPHPLTDRVECLNAGGVLVGVEADAFGGEMVDGNEHRGLALCGDRCRQIGVIMVPSWLRGPRGDPTRDGASRSFSLVSRSTRRFEVRTPATRSRAQILR